MYARQPPDGRFPRTVRVPRNYSGSAFRDEGLLSETPVVNDENPISQSTSMASLSDLEENASLGEASTSSTGKLVPSPGFRLDLSRFLHKDKGGIGFEELLIIGLIFLLSQSETKDDLVFLLLLLLFVQ